MKPTTKKAKIKQQDAEFKRDWQTEMRRVTQNPNYIGWSRLFYILEDALDDKEILSSVAATNFLNIMRELVADSFTYGDVIQAFRPIAPKLAGDLLRDNSGRIKGGERMKQRAAEHTELLKVAVVAILKNPATSDWRDPDIARWLMEPERAHKFNPKPLTEKTMTTRVKKIRADYKASI